MSIPVKHYGVYRFRNYAYNNNQCLNAYGSTNLTNGRNVMLYTNDSSDKAQQWRAMYAGKYDNHVLYWLNCELGGLNWPFALDRFTGTLYNNADVYMAANSSAQDQLLYFMEEGNTGCFSIHLYNKYNSSDIPVDLALTAAANPDGINGNNNPTSLAQAGNVYWAEYVSSNNAQKWLIETKVPGADPSTSDRATDFPSNIYYVHNNDANYPYFVGECTWYCNGRFFEVNDVVSCGTGNAVDWINNYNTGSCLCDTTNKILRQNSVAVFGPTVDNPSSYGHVVFIEDLENDNVIFSECNRTVGGKFALSNKEIEVKNIYLPDAVDGYKQVLTRNAFCNLYGFALIGIIYKNPNL